MAPQSVDIISVSSSESEPPSQVIEAISISSSSESSTSFYSAKNQAEDSDLLQGMYLFLLSVERLNPLVTAGALPDSGSVSMDIGQQEVTTVSSPSKSSSHPASANNSDNSFQCELFGHKYLSLRESNGHSTRLHVSGSNRWS